MAWLWITEDDLVSYLILFSKHIQKAFVDAGMKQWKINFYWKNLLERHEQVVVFWSSAIIQEKRQLLEFPDIFLTERFVNIRVAQPICVRQTFVWIS